LNARINNLVERAKNPRDKNFRNHIYIFLICCGISLFIWFLIKMSNDYVADIGMELEFTSIPDDKQLNNDNERIIVRLRANGGDLFSVKYLSLRRHIEVDLGRIEPKKSRYFDRYYILTRQLRPGISERFDFDHSLIGISPDTIYLELDDIISRSVKVRPRLEVKCKPQYMVYDSLLVMPTDIMVSGPASMIDTISYINTEYKKVSGLDDTMQVTLPLILPGYNDNISFSEKEVEIIIPVQQFTESTIRLPVQGSSEDTGIGSIRTFPEYVELTYQVAIKDYQLVKDDMFRASVLYDPVKDKKKTFLKVHIDESPDFIRIMRIDPDKVEYIIQK
jgi:hypothetical protein